MEEFIDLYRYLTRCYIGLEQLERNNILESFQGFSKLVSHEKTGPLLINLLSDIVKRSDEEDGAMNDALKVVLPVILDIELLVGNSAISDNLDKKPGNIHLFDKETVLRSFGACKVYPKIFEYVFTNLKTKFCNEDAAILILKYYDDVLNRDIAASSSRTYANCYLKYMLEENLVTAEFGTYTKKTKDSKETKELKEFGESINGNGKTSLDLKPDEPKTEEKSNNTTFTEFQDRILEVAEHNKWNQVSIETIEESFKRTKSELQVQKALGQLLVKGKITQMPPTMNDLIDAKKYDKPKPKGSIIFKRLKI